MARNIPRDARKFPCLAVLGEPNFFIPKMKRTEATK
jgi:hypothetical protein